ncbi:Chromosome transmission fidelity protein 18 [Thelohanellus kitauei]|uniref:Chromosome transmission fidelity protein 18 n=1 Tax=Thelohanellus kitauei TaxID=669202 RepID=A0A0C2MXS8_THEKT|nr:Chromosome transmission fidelity protein 18 [Thelohanellus kitauei]
MSDIEEIEFVPFSPSGMKRKTKQDTLPTKISKVWDIDAIDCQSVTLPNGESMRLQKRMPIVPLKGDNDGQYINKLMRKVIQNNNSFRGTEVAETSENELWVTKYGAKQYIDLLTDERSNRMLLRWLKLWDHKYFKKANHKPQTSDFVQGYKDMEKSIVLDENGMPKQKTVLISGNCGSGKTTMAKIIANHCGFRALEVNLSYDCSISTTKSAINEAKSNTLLGSKPTCLIFDDIDNAPKVSR